MLVSDETVFGHYGRGLIDTLAAAGIEAIRHTFPPGEAAKSLVQATRLFEALAAGAFGRDSLLLAFGGGAVSDAAGFVAATWMRGIAFAILPTTLEAMIDASIGGKTALNLPAGKNLVGAFHSPRFVLADPAVLATLPARDLRAGLAESIKHALIADGPFLEWHEHHLEDVLTLQEPALTQLIARNVRIKGDVVARDPFERTGQRAALNFGHTVGHAIETCSGHTFRHGECVAIGMVAACRLSHRVVGLDRSFLDRVEALLIRAGLPTTIDPALSREDLLAAMRLDKKAAANRLRFVLIAEPGRPVLRDDIGLALLRDVLDGLYA